MTNPYFRIARTSLGLTAAEIGQQIGKSLRTVRLYDSGQLDPSPESREVTSSLVSDMAKKIDPYLTIRSSTQRTYTLYDYSSEEDLYLATGDEYLGWTLAQYRTLLGHIMVILEAKGLTYQFVQYEQKEN